jgi:hypothetical protein
MAHLQRDDIPYQYALADAFTICDAYHCSLLGPTDPNRYHMFTGWVGNDGRRLPLSSNWPPLVPGEPCAVAKDKAQYTRHRRSRFAHVDRLFPGSANVREGS